MVKNLRFWGTSAGEGTPTPFCECDICRTARAVGGPELRLRSSFRIDEETMLDIGADFNAAALKMGETLFGLKNVLYTHTHEDHFNYMMIWTRYVARKKPDFPLNIYFVDKAYDILEKFYFTSPVTSGREGYTRPSDVNFVRLEFLREYEIGGHRVTPLRGNHVTAFEDNSANYLIKLADGRKIPLNEDGRCYLNWYGEQESFKYIPLWEADKAIKENNINYLNSTFNNKIIFVGVTTTSLNDIKSTPTSRMFAGVETHATFLNNIFDNNLIKKTSNLFDIIATIILTLLTAFIVVKSKNVPYAILGVIALIIIYSILTILIMHFLNLWVGLVLPLVCSIGTVTGCYAIKYIVTSRDYEHTYKLAVTDGLTDMYNHRYFQEQMKLNIDNAKRYNTPFSLIMVDIDFFKKFNDKYGHQSGDAVLRQVAQTIKKNIRSTDIPCRYGGEEMSVILSNTKKEEAYIVAQKICEAVRNKEFELATGDWTHVTISLGVASAPFDSDSVQGLIEYADKCLYIAKENGRNQVVSKIENN